MIKIFKSESGNGVSLHELNTGKFLYGEVCSNQRLMQFINSFPQHQIEIYVEKNGEDELQELFYILPHLEEYAKVIKQRKVNPHAMVSNASKNKKKVKTTLIQIAIGVLIGVGLLVPTSTEYKSSVLRQANAVESFAAEFAENQPNWDSVSMLYSSIESLYKEVRVESITYSTGEYKIIFSSARGDVALGELIGFSEATLELVSSLKSKENGTIHIYELEGAL